MSGFNPSFIDFHSDRLATGHVLTSAVLQCLRLAGAGRQYADNYNKSVEGLHFLLTPHWDNEYLNIDNKIRTTALISYENGDEDAEYHCAFRIFGNIMRLIQRKNLSWETFEDDYDTDPDERPIEIEKEVEPQPITEDFS